MEATVAVVKGQGEAQLTEREEEHERRLEELQEAHKASLRYMCSACVNSKKKGIETEWSACSDDSCTVHVHENL